MQEKKVYLKNRVHVDGVRNNIAIYIAWGVNLRCSVELEPCETFKL